VQGALSRTDATVQGVLSHTDATVQGALFRTDATVQGVLSHTDATVQGVLSRTDARSATIFYVLPMKRNKNYNVSLRSRDTWIGLYSSVLIKYF